MANFNKVILLGNLTRDPQLRYLPSNTAVCDFGLAVNRKYRGQDGELKDETCFVDVDVFGKPAETISQYMSKGRPLLVEGRLRFRQWTTEDGLPSNNVRTIDASDWVVLIGTDAGMISWFRNNLLPLRTERIFYLSILRGL